MQSFNTPAQGVESDDALHVVGLVNRQTGEQRPEQCVVGLEAVRLRFGVDTSDFGRHDQREGLGLVARRAQVLVGVDLNGGGLQVERQVYGASFAVNLTLNLHGIMTVVVEVRPAHG